MRFNGYCILTTEEIEDAQLNDEDIEVFSSLECLEDVHGVDCYYSVIEYYDFDNISEN